MISTQEVIAPLAILLWASGWCALATGAEAGCQFDQGRADLQITAAGVEREYRIAVGPLAARAERPPLVFLWHGFGGDNMRFSGVLQPARDWPQAVVVSPRGLPRTFPRFSPHARRGWQIATGEYGDRDLALFDALLSQLTRTHCVDRHRVFSAGFSNGGAFSHLLACARPAMLAGIGVVGGFGPRESDCVQGAPPGPAVLVVHGLNDRVIDIKRAETSMALWESRLACQQRLALGDSARCIARAGCSAPLHSCTFSGGHRWPSDATPTIVNFFRR